MLAHPAHGGLRQLSKHAVPHKPERGAVESIEQLLNGITSVSDAEMRLQNKQAGLLCNLGSIQLTVEGTGMASLFCKAGLAEPARLRS
eukprot:Transcript_3314.p3 GENE.Transcript_3314~~Transcript_3314.p3  ORF type:complete len:88 (-),score=17.22 Transcript_3314:684-947(-)